MLFKKSDDLQAFLSNKRQSGVPIGFVPTMGALHKGHISLIELSKKKKCLTVCSIFINPIQFNDPKDFEKYPVTLVSDLDLLIQSGCDVLYLPSVDEMYPEGLQTTRENIPLRGLDTILEGASRPGHFQGVAFVVKRLLERVQPDFLFMGQKDFQQVLVVREMIHHFKLPIRVISGPIIREETGLAMSSRNIRLSAPVRKKAGVIYAALKHIADNYYIRSWSELRQEAIDMILKELPDAGIDYLLSADIHTLKEITPTQDSPAVILTAIWVEGVRLLDNILVGSK